MVMGVHKLVRLVGYLGYPPWWLPYAHGVAVDKADFGNSFLASMPMLKRSALRYEDFGSPGAASDLDSCHRRYLVPGV